VTGPLSFPNDRPIRGEEELLELFLSGCKPREAWGIGLEYERLGLDRLTARAIPYSGAHGVERALLDLSERCGWTLVREESRAIGLTREGSLVSLEPGGQMELSARVHRTLAGVADELRGFVAETSQVAALHGFAWVPLGLQPVSRIEEIEWVPKRRYGIMAPHLGSRGTLAHHMMKGTAGCQLNFDYGSEEDAAAKLRTAMGITSIVTAAFANSPVYDSRGTGFLTRRAAIWLDTDPSRCGLPAFAFRDDLSFRDYLEYALDVPLIFARRGDAWIDGEGIPFRRYLLGGHRGLRATLGDWMLHLTTIFTEVRLKTYLEVRGADSVPPDLAMALAALWTGILHDPASLAGAWNLVRKASYEERLAFHADVCRIGPAAVLGGTSAGDLARELSRIAREGLLRLGEDAGLLAPLDASLAEGGGCPGARLGPLRGDRRDIEVFLGAARDSESRFLDASENPSR